MNAFALFCHITDVLDGLFNRHRLTPSGDFRSHDTARGFFAITEQFTDGIRVFDAHKAQEAFCFAVIKVADDVGSIVGIHFSQQVRSASLGEVFNDVGLVLLFEL